MTDEQLPPGWASATIEQLGSGPAATVIGPFGSSLKVADYRDEGVPLVFVRNIRSGDFLTGRRFVSCEKAAELASHQVFSGDVLVTKMGDPPGDAYVYTDAEPSIITADCIRVRTAPGISAPYLRWAIESPQVRSRILEMTSGVAQQKVSLARFRDLPLPVAPRAEQKRIVAELERRFSHLDAAATWLRGADLRLRLVRRALDYKLLWQPQHATVQLESVLLPHEGLANGRSVRDREGGFPVLRLTSLRDGRIDPSEFKEGDWVEAEARKYLIREGDVLVARGNGSLDLVGRAGLVSADPPAVAYPDTLIRVRADPAVIRPDYLCACWNSGSVRSQIESVARTTAGIYKVNQQHIASVSIPLPTLEQQVAIVDELTRVNSNIDAAKAGVDQSLDRIDALRRSLLDAAFSGRLVPQDPDDEPASELLARIAKTRAEAEAAEKEAKAAARRANKAAKETMA